MAEQSVTHLDALLNELRTIARAEQLDPYAQGVVDDAVEALIVGRALEAIIRDLAADEPSLPVGHDDEMCCAVCGGNEASEREPVEHESTCAYLLAVEWVAEHPASEGDE